MTPDQTARCTALACRIAELAPNGDWAVAGMACRDPGTGFLWRRMSCYWSPDDEDGWGTDIASDCGRRALAAGPYWRDTATLNALLGECGAVSLKEEGDRSRWRWGAHIPPVQIYFGGDTRAEAILAAKVAQLEHLSRLEQKK